jgi:hypothetical protein
MRLLLTLKLFFESLGGAESNGPSKAVPPFTSWMWGVWWTVLAAAIMFFSGQSSKFIYIDF